MAGNLSWELDIWGRFRRAIESADAGLDASVQEYDAILVSLIAEVVTAYIDIRTFEQRLEYARTECGDPGEESATDASSRRGRQDGKDQCLSVRVEPGSNQGEHSAAGDRIAASQQSALHVAGYSRPRDLSESLGGTRGIPSAPARVAVGIPADLLRRRPDVRAAERRVAAQSAQIGVALADLYPSIAVTGEISVSAEEFQDLFKSLSTGGSIGPSFRWNVLNYGRIQSNVRIQEARFQELIATYQNTVLSANEEVENALVAFLKTQEQVKSLAASVQATQRALELELLNFKEGETDFSGVFVLQGDLAVKQDQLASAQGQVVVSLVDVYKALGGGWQIRVQGFEPVAMAIFPEMIDELPTPVADPAPASDLKPATDPIPPDQANAIAPESLPSSSEEGVADETLPDQPARDNLQLNATDRPEL